MKNKDSDLSFRLDGPFQGGTYMVTDNNSKETKVFDHYPKIEEIYKFVEENKK